MSGAEALGGRNCADGSAVAHEARRWLGTPYVHQAARRGLGADCLGLVRGVWSAVVGPWPERVPPYTADWSEASGEEVLWRAARRHLLPARGAVPQAGDVLLFRMRRGAVAKHLGIVVSGAEAIRFVHAYSGHGVVESSLSPAWQARVVARFCFPGGAGSGSAMRAKAPGGEFASRRKGATEASRPVGHPRLGARVGNLATIGKRGARWQP
ncbi:hypothetical protein BV394_00410 [Brevirhabdus pacifica]|uniref:Uncharacterized protein n=1 Tax=Brevirhabdus pacifica TaxID=1267768 RepID=A0A1U7DEI1_9RHOB|nr:hypothetical protein BV394_00410 [Brevirhabdus pacifica]PJJ87163.1 NlpC/P60 family putative phage cell wall peptidase [Brevirhabdus pacifica]